jgi:APA family basic amino acid/polyamine antiporter
VTHPKRQLGVLVAAAIVVANMIGSGVFTSAGLQAAYQFKDPWSMMSTWLVGGLLALCGAACYAELGSRMPHAGGEYVYLREAYHPAFGFMSGWVSLVVGFSAPIAAAALLFAGFVGAIAPALATGVAAKAIACALILAMTALHAFDTRLGGRVQTGFTIAKVALIVVFVLAGLLVGHGDWSHFASRGDGLSQLGTRHGAAAYATALMYVSFAYSGWNAAAYVAGEIEHPQRTLPRALLVGTGTVMLLYLGLNLVFLYAVPPEAMAVDPIGHPVGDIAARALFGEHAGSLLSSLIALALMSAVSAMMMAGPRVYATMAADHALPRQLAYYSKRGVPVAAVAVQCVLAIAFTILSDPDHLIRLVGFTLALFAALTVGAVFVMRMRDRRDAARVARATVESGGQGPVAPIGFRTPLYPLAPLLFVALSVWTVIFGVQAEPKLSAEILGVLVAGAAIYVVTARGKPRTPIEADE